jgi:predicted dehydrogenase
VTDRVVLVGLGNISSPHLRALERIASVGDVVGVDTSPHAEATFRGTHLRIHAGLPEALCGGADLVVVATPTASHATVVDAVRALDHAVPILVEKPAADRPEAAERVLAASHGVETIFHSGFAPEVVWATDIYAAARQRLGHAVAFEARFANPYAQDLAGRTASLANSWLDSGINALSIIGRFTIPTAVTSFRQLEGHVSTFEARFALGSAEAWHGGTIVTTWQAAEQTQSTRLHFSGGAELALDHIAGTATLLEDGAVTASYTRPEVEARLEGHYANFYGDYFGDRRLRYPAEAGRQLHALLFSALGRLA